MIEYSSVFTLQLSSVNLLSCRWKQELSAALELAGDHIALYQLTVEPGTPLYRQVRAGTWLVIYWYIGLTFRKVKQIHFHIIEEKVTAWF